jgi:hypothetical protein
MQNAEFRMKKASSQVGILAAGLIAYLAWKNEVRGSRFE